MNERYDNEIVACFVAPDKKSRYKFGLSRPKHRYAVLVKLFANAEIDLNFVSEGRGQIKDDETCYVWSCNAAMDGKMMSFTEAYHGDSILGVLIYCPRNQKAFFRDEAGDEYDLEKTK